MKQPLNVGDDCERDDDDEKDDGDNIRNYKNITGQALHRYLTY